mmetsp:Transcript_13998/g.24544  ORF Transcript_13998/g.24544 Transcript_13998/m.24544 type:complete len:472 (+) Transcript_13998:83-1498(+)|eukprot:CAMPEP_0119106908 /NCGR_PEP_ID=MMETSP1180-20130426/7230_1 /TAXON_ID=3052 ORGANISM="Chlamydomonas cf sp, Strain CCMP681" /NCGR_SAMPLE_ID=MMETSP1180 /ASSEMBLY_ACC=CAM_ASM_000741 /LENGTH=471 /DNA_ID=CAMNT_0007092315 /DNA_START=67 /DNA_END=1482 /DNA_ORIENTATION=+
MGGLGRLGEKLKQALGITRADKIGGQEWKPTSNARNECMVVEARKFAQHLKLLLKDLGLLEKEVDGSFHTIKSVLGAPLPRAYDETAAGVALVDKEPRVVGVYVDVDGVTSATVEMKRRLHEEVLHPLEQWLSAYRMIKERNKKVETLRLDLDNQRRLTMGVQEKYEKLRGANRVNVRELESTEHRVATQEDKNARLVLRYQEAEAEVFNALLTLIRDTSVLRDYAAAALAIMQRCFTLAYGAFDFTTPVPLITLPPPAVPMLKPASLSAQISDGNGTYLTGSPGMPPVLHLSGSPNRPLRSQTGSRGTTGSSGGALPLSATMRGDQSIGNYTTVQAATSAGGATYGGAILAPPSPNADAVGRSTEFQNDTSNPGSAAVSVRDGSPKAVQNGVIATPMPEPTWSAEDAKVVKVTKTPPAELSKPVYSSDEEPVSAAVEDKENPFSPQTAPVTPEKEQENPFSAQPAPVPAL